MFTSTTDASLRSETRTDTWLFYPKSLPIHQPVKKSDRCRVETMRGKRRATDDQSGLSLRIEKHNPALNRPARKLRLQIPSPRQPVISNVNS
jgi:hypothetical protein